MKGRFISHSAESKGYRILLYSGLVVESHDVRFWEVMPVNDFKYDIPPFDDNQPPPEFPCQDDDEDDIPVAPVRYISTAVVPVPIAEPTSPLPNPPVSRQTLGFIALRYFRQPESRRITASVGTRRALVIKAIKEGIVAPKSHRRPCSSLTAPNGLMLRPRNSRT